MYYVIISLFFVISFLFLFVIYISKFLYGITSKYYYISKNNLFTDIEDAIFADYTDSLHIFSKYTTVNIEGEDWLAHTIIVK